MDLITIESRIIVPEIKSVTVGTTRIKAPGATEEMITTRSTAIPGTINLTGHLSIPYDGSFLRGSFFGGGGGGGLGVHLN